MNKPQMFNSTKVAPETTALVSYIPIPGFGVLPVNAFVIHAQQPILVDTGLASLRSEFMRSLHSIIDPAQLRWIWITHTDPDHLGNLNHILALAPNARVVTTYLGMGKMNMHGLPMDRVYLLNPGQFLDVGDRQILALTPPTFDAPETTGLFDCNSATLFSADCFGALLEKPEENAALIKPKTLYDGSITWASVDAPWLGMIEASKFGKALSDIEKLDAKTVLSSHLPPAVNMTKILLDILGEAHQAPPFRGPDQRELEKMMAA